MPDEGAYYMHNVFYHLSADSLTTSALSVQRASPPRFSGQETKRFFVKTKNLRISCEPS